MFRRALSILLCGCLLAGSLPVTGFAAEEQVVETTDENAGGGYHNNTPEPLEDNADSLNTAENADISKEVRGTENAPDKVTEQKPQSEDIMNETTEPQTEIPTEEVDTDEMAVNKEGDEAVTPVIKDVQEGGYYIAADIELPSTIDDAYLYWKEKGSDNDTDYVSVSDGECAILYPVKQSSEYVLQLRADSRADAQVYDEKEITTSADYKFQTSVSVENITMTSADIKVAITDYNGAYPKEFPEIPYAYLYAMTKYTNVQGREQEESGQGELFFMKEEDNDKECTITISLSDLQPDTAYTLPVWVSEYREDDSLRKQIDNVAFTTLKSDFASKIQLEAEADATSNTVIHYTISLSDSDTLAETYDYKLFYRIKGAPESEFTECSGSLTSTNQYKDTGEIMDLYEGTEYELRAVVEGVEETMDISTGGITPEISLSPLSFGGKLNIGLTGVSDTGDTYCANAYLVIRDNFWLPLYAKSKTDIDQYNKNMDLTSENNYRGEWLIYYGSDIDAGASYDIRIDIQKNNTTISSKYLKLDTSKISLKLETGEIKGKSAKITCELVNSDEFFEFFDSSEEIKYIDTKVYYREKGSEDEWTENASAPGISKKETDSFEIENLNRNTEYEVKVTSYNNENVVYGTIMFTTTEGTAEGTYRDVDVRFDGFKVIASGNYEPSDYADTMELYLVEKDSTGTVLAESELNYDYKSGKPFSVNDVLYMETAKVQIKAVETWEDKDAEGNPVEKEFLSGEYTREKVPDVTFSISNTDTDVQTFRADLTYTGDMCIENSVQRIMATLYYGTSEEDSVNNYMKQAVTYSKNGSKTQMLMFDGLTENTEYHGKIVVSVESSLSGSAVEVYRQEIPLENFTTKENNTYLLEDAFPDARLREWIISRAGLDSGATEVTAEQLERITSLFVNRSDFDTAAITDLTGIELLTGLTDLYLQNNEISDTPAVDWSKLTLLKTLNLTGNDLTKIPDFSKNKNLTAIYLKENMIPAEEFETASEKLPAGVTLSSETQSSQRIGGLQVIAEETYYQRAGKSPLLVKIKGYKTGLPYTFKYLVDGDEITLPQNTEDGIWYNTDTGLAVGSHALTIEMYQETEKKTEKNVTFQMAEGGTYVEETSYRFSAQESYYDLRVYSDKELSAAYMQKGNDIAAVNQYDISGYPSEIEYRYKTLSNSGISLSGSSMYSSGVSLIPLKHKKPEVGIYDLKVVYADNTEETLQGVIEMIDKAFIMDGSIGYSYDSTGKYFYLSLGGYGFDASQLEYAFTYDGKQQTATYVNAKETSSGYIIKFKKDDAWTPKEGDRVQVKLTSKDGYDVIFDRDTFMVSILEGIYYCAYNEVSNKIEVGVTSNLKRENVTFKLARYNSWDDIYDQSDVIETIDVNSEIVTETISYLVPMKDGEVYKLPGGYYRLDMTSNDYSAYTAFDIYADNTNYWSGQKYIIESTGDTNFWYYSEIPYVKDNQGEFTAEITSENLTAPLNAGRIWINSYADNALSSVGMTFNLSTLAEGNYTVTVSHNNQKLSAYAFEVIPGGKFVMMYDDSLYASWIDNSSFQVCVNTINTAELDKFTVGLTDIFGNKVEELETEVTNRYSDAVYLKVTGLEKKDAYRHYYIYVTHDTLGEPYKLDRTTEYFGDEKGQYKEISDGKFTWTYTNDRVCGIGMYSGIAFPVTVKVYEAYDTELITSFTIAKDDLESGTNNPAWYYFKQSLIDAIPDKDALYDVVIIDSNRQTEDWTAIPIGLRQSSATTEWTVSPTQLSLNLDSDENKTGTITVTGSIGTPTFESDNTKVATVAADEADQNKAIVTAVAEGTATISITADSITKTVAVTVTKEISDEEQDDLAKEIGSLYFLEGADSSLADIKLPDGWSWENPTEKLTADNSHPVQDFAAVYSKDDVSFERYLDVYVSKLDSVRITGKSTVNSQKEALYTCTYNYVGADFDSGYEINWQWTLGENLAADTNTGERITVKVSGNDTLSVMMTVTNTATGKTISQDASLQITAGEIPDSEPELENKKITIYKNSTQHVPIGLVAKDGNSITAVTVAGNTDFKFERDEDGEWLIELTDSGKGKYAKKTTETLTLKVKTESGKECEKTLGVIVDVTEINAKNVKFKQTLKPNAVYSDTSTVRAEFSVSSKYIIEDIIAADGNEKFAVKRYDLASGTLVLEAKTDTLDLTTKSYPAKAVVKVKDYGTWTIDINVAVQNKKPSLKLGDAVILKRVNADASVVLNSGKTELSCSDYTITKTEGEGVTLTKDGSTVKVAYTGDKNGSYKAKIRKNTWAPGVEMELKGKVSVLDPAKAKLSADLTKATINITGDYSAPVTVTVGIKGSSVPVYLTAQPANAAVTAEVIGNGKIQITPTNGAAKGNYKVTVNGSVGGTAIKGMTVSVTLTDKAPEVKLAAKGKINLANREGTSIVYTPTLKNLPETLSIKNVRMDKTAADSGFFNVKMNDDGKVVMTAVTGKTMNPKTKYKPVLIFTLSNGKTLKTDTKFTVSVTNNLPKVTVTTLSSALCTSNTEQRASYRVSAGNGYMISNVTTDDTNYKVTFNGRTNTVTVSLSDSASVAAGKKYTVPCIVYIKGADNTTKPLTVKLKVVVY